VPFQSAEAYRRFAESVKHDRRYIYDGEVTAFLDAVDETAVSRTKTIPHGIHLWRAQLGSTIRIQDEGEPEEMEVDVPFTDARMKPLPTIVGDGRANPRGVAYLYLADSATTAGSELRPWLGASLSISQFHINRELKIVDCTSDKKRWNLRFDAEMKIVPWKPEEYESVVWGDIGEAMSRPYNPQETSLNYVPTQIIAEHLRHAGVEGIAYNSLLSKGGQNFVLFDIKDADPVNFTLYEVDKVSYTITQCDNTYFNRAKPDAK
jgi:hypothetical protein